MTAPTTTSARARACAISRSPAAWSHAPAMSNRLGPSIVEASAAAVTPMNRPANITEISRLAAAGESPGSLVSTGRAAGGSVALSPIPAKTPDSATDIAPGGRRSSRRLIDRG